MYDRGDDATAAARKAVMGALSLSLDIISLSMMLRLMGGRRKSMRDSHARTGSPKPLCFADGLKPLDDPKEP